MNAKKLETVFPLGSHLCREPMPAMSELKHDMALLKASGFNLIKLQEHWQIDEPLEGQYDFSRCQELIEHAAKLDLGVYLGLTCEQAPHWLWEKHPDCRMVGRNGLPIAYEAQSTLPADGKPGPCFDHPGALSDHIRFIRKLVEVLGQYHNIVVWNTWQEVGYWAEDLAGQGVCFCPHTLAAYRRWLADRYGDLDGLNRAWNARHLDWSQVVPTRSARAQYPLPQDLDWRYFMDNVQIATVLRGRADAIRQADPLHRPIFAHKGWPIIGSGMDWTYARCQDFLGSSAYPAGGALHAWDDNRPESGKPFDHHVALSSEMWDLRLKFDYMRGCNPPDAPLWAAEFQGGPISIGFHKGRVPSPQDIRRWMLTVVGCDTSAVVFWVTRAEISPGEANGFSLLDSTGESTPRFQEAARVGAALNRHADLFGRPSRPRSQTAILINERNYQLCISMDPGGGNLAYDIRGWHRLLGESGIESDFLELSALDHDYARRYKALVLPMPLLLSDEDAARLCRYVQDGGALICEPCPGRMDAAGYCRRGELSPHMAELFGVRQESLTMVREPGGEVRWSPPERTWGEYLDAAVLAGEGPLAGHQLRANVCIQTFVCQTGQPCLRYGETAAGAFRRVGKGQAWLLGTFVGHNGTAYRDKASHAAVVAILSRCGVAPACAGKLLLRKRAAASKEAWLFTNPTTEKIAERIDVAGWSRVEDLLGGDIATAAGGVELSVDPLDVRVLVVSR